MLRYKYVYLIADINVKMHCLLQQAMYFKESNLKALYHSVFKQVLHICLLAFALNYLVNSMQDILQKRVAI